MLLREFEGGLLLQGKLIEAVLQDRFDGSVGDAPDATGPVAGRFQPLRGVPVPEAQDAEAGAITLSPIYARRLGQPHLNFPRAPSPTE